MGRKQKIKMEPLIHLTCVYIMFPLYEKSTHISFFFDFRFSVFSISNIVFHYAERVDIIKLMECTIYQLIDSISSRSVWLVKLKSIKEKL